MNNEINIKNKKLKLFAKYILLGVLFYIFFNAKICDVLPFATALLFALMWTGFNLLAISFEYVLTGLLKDFSLQNLYTLITVVAVLFFAFLIHKRFKRPMNILYVSLYMVISQISFVYYYVLNGYDIVNLIVYFILLLTSLYMFSLVFQTLLLRGVFYKLTINEIIAFCYCFIVFGIGVSVFEVFDVQLAKIVVIALILFLSFIKKTNEACYLSLSFGLGVYIASFQSSLLVTSCVAILAVNIFKYPNRYKMAFCVILADIVVQIYLLGLKEQVAYMVFATLIAVLLVFVVPNKVLLKLQDKFYVCESEMSMRNIVNITRQNLHRRFKELSNVFNEMSVIHLNMIKDDLTQEQVVNMLTNELMKTICKDCLERQKCFRALGADEKSVIAKLVGIALNKGKISLLDIPSKLAIRCNMVNLLIGRINQIVVQYSQFVGMKKEVNNVKYLLSEQLGAVSQIMLDLGQEIDKHINFDAHNELQIINELLAENIICSELLLYNEKDEDFSVSLIVKGDNAYNPKIEEIISKKLKTKMRVDKVEPIELNDYFSVHLVKDENFDIVFGLSNYTKSGSEVSGDTHSLIRLGGNKFLVALCDGMGSGEKANRTSALTINLIENFYKAGFSNDTIISSVNKLLAINNQENFATLDLSIIDLNKQLVDFVKIGASYSYIKHQNYLEKIEGGALPIGVLENITPFVYKSSIDSHSMIIMTTDGVSDAFKETEEFEDFINGIVSTNPQIVAQTIIDEAVRRSDNIIKDDMTVLVVRTFLKNT